MKLHLGCFDQPVDGWHNTDITHHIFVSRIPFAAKILSILGIIPDLRLRQHKAGIFRKVHYLNVSKPFPYKTESVDCVFSSHLIEHLHPHAASHMLTEIYRVLKPGGICRVVAPDLDWAMSLYQSNNPEPFLRAVFEHDHPNPKNRHQWMYTSSSLCDLLRKHGFVDVEQCKYRKGNLPDLNLIENRSEYSIYVECRKPFAEQGSRANRFG